MFIKVFVSHTPTRTSDKSTKFMLIIKSQFMKHLILLIFLLCAALTRAQILNDESIAASSTTATTRSGINLEKIINTTVGKSVTLSPWSVVSSKASGFSCISTSLRKVSDDTALSVHAGSKTRTFYPSMNTNGYLNGFYCPFYAKALKAGTYTVLTHVHCCQRKGVMPVVYTDADYFVTYHIVVSEKPKVTSIVMPSNQTMHVGDSYQFVPQIYEEGSETTLTWSSSNPSVASIDSNGKAIAKMCGQSIITCMASNGVSARCDIVVEPVYVDKIELGSQELELKVGERASLSVAIMPSNATYKGVKWTSSNEDVAFVSDNGMVIGIASGYSNVKATAIDGSDVFGSCLVHITSPESSDIRVASLGQGEISCKKGLLTITPKHEGIVIIASVSGTVIDTLHVKGGNTYQIPLPEGVYIVNGNKVRL